MRKVQQVLVKTSPRNPNIPVRIIFAKFLSVSVKTFWIMTRESSDIYR